MTGVTTGLWGRWPIWGTKSAIRRSARPAAGAGAQAHDNLGDVHSDPSGAAGGDGFLHRGGAHAARVGDILRAVFHASGEPPITRRIEPELA